MIGTVEQNLAARSLFFMESVAQRFVHDDRGRLVPGAGAYAATVPRFYLGRAPGLTFWRFSATLDAERVTQLARLAALERPLSGEFMKRIEMPPPPERLPALSVRLGRGEAASLRFRGPLLAFESVMPEGRLPEKARIRPLGASFEEKPAVEPGSPGVVLEVAGQVVATCRSRRHWPDWGAECVAETAETERGRGYGQAVLRAWCETIRRRGEVPLARPQWSDRSALGLARSVGASCVGEGFEFD